jgi:hypothetical protein
MNADVEPVVEFAIRWAPFGGASAGDMLVGFGVGRQRFVQMFQVGLRPRETDSPEIRWRKLALLDALTAAWRVDEDAPSESVRY